MDVGHGRVARRWLLCVGWFAAFVWPGMALAQAERAMAALDQKDCEGAVDALNRGMADGETRSMYMVGQMFESGVCLKVDAGRAAPIYEQAASRGDAASARALALLDARGAGVAQSYAKAGYWFAVARGATPASPEALAGPDDIVRAYVEAVHGLAEDNMVYPTEAATKGIRGTVVMRFDPRSAAATLVSSVDDQSNATSHLGPNKHLFERALATSDGAAIKALPRPDVPVTGDFATDHAAKFGRDRNSRDGPSGYQGLRR